MSAPAFVAQDHLSGRVRRVGAYTIRYRARAVGVAVVGCVAAIVLAALELAYGTFQLTFGEVWEVLAGGGSATARKVVLEIRLPRVVAGLFDGACSGVSGAVFQSVARNALGSPDVIGFTSGAATGAIVQMLVFDRGPMATSLAAIAGGTGTALIVYLLSLRGGVAGGYRLVLVGIGVGSVLSSLNGLFLTRSAPDDAIAAHAWLVGTLNARTWEQVVPVVIVFFITLPAIAAARPSLDLVEMGDDTARQLGVAVERSRKVALIGGVALIAIATAATGPIAFVALAAPQIARRLIGAPTIPIAGAAVIGAAVLLGADYLSQRLPFGLYVPVGLTTGLLGGIYLIALLLRPNTR